MTDKTDFMGQEIEVGDAVIYSLASYGRGLLIGQIAKFNPKMVSVKRIYPHGHTHWQTGKDKPDNVYNTDLCKVDENYVTLLLLKKKPK